MTMPDKQSPQKDDPKTRQSRATKRHAPRNRIVNRPDSRFTLTFTLTGQEPSNGKDSCALTKLNNKMKSN